MRTRWEGGDVSAPLTLIVSAFAPVDDAALTLTPELRRDVDDTRLLLIDLGSGRDRLGGSALAQCYGQLGCEAPDVDDPAALRRFFEAVQAENRAGRLLAYHDRSDGGLLVTVLEMAFAGRTGLDLDVSGARRFASGAVRRGARGGGSGACRRRRDRAPGVRRRRALRRDRCPAAGSGGGGPARRQRAAAGRPRRAAAPLGADELSDAAAAGRPGLRRRGISGAGRRRRSGAVLQPHVRRQRRMSPRRSCARHARGSLCCASRG